MPTGVGGRNHTSGRYDTRQELVNAVWYYKLYTPLHDEQIWDFCRIGRHTFYRLFAGDEEPESWIHITGTEHQLMQRLSEHDYAEHLHRLGISTN